jgi:hypothetical protein
VVRFADCCLVLLRFHFRLVLLFPFSLLINLLSLTYLLFVLHFLFALILLLLRRLRCLCLQFWLFCSFESVEVLFLGLWVVWSFSETYRSQICTSDLNLESIPESTNFSTL